MDHDLGTIILICAYFTCMFGFLIHEPIEEYDDEDYENFV